MKISTDSAGRKQRHATGGWKDADTQHDGISFNPEIQSSAQDRQLIDCFSGIGSVENAYLKPSQSFSSARLADDYITLYASG